VIPQVDQYTTNSVNQMNTFDSFELENEEGNRESRDSIMTRLKFQNAKDNDLIIPSVRAEEGGVYLPPHKMKKLQQNIKDKNSIEYQRLSWEALKKSINGLVNKVNLGNVQNIIPDFFRENLVRGRGLLCHAILKAQQMSPTYTAVYCALISVINTKMPEIGELLLKRVIMGFRKAYRLKDKQKCTSFSMFIGHLLNQQVAHEVLAGQLLGLLLEKPTDDSVEISVQFTKECGQVLNSISPKIVTAVFERFREILQEEEVSKRVQYLIEGLFLVRKKNFSEYPGIVKELDLVEAEDQITHELELDEEDLDTCEALDYFQYDNEFQENEERYEQIKREILGDVDDEQMDEYLNNSNNNNGEGEPGEEVLKDQELFPVVVVPETTDTIGSSSMPIMEKSKSASLTTAATVTASSKPNDNDVNVPAAVVVVEKGDKDLLDIVQLKKQIYLTIMSSVQFEETVHKLVKAGLTEGHEAVVCSMIIECCSQERTYLRYYGLMGQRFCQLDRQFQIQFDEAFKQQYGTVHRLDTNKLRNIAKFFAHLLFSDSLSWSVMEYIRLNQDETTSSSRIFVKYLFQELSENMGLKKLHDRLHLDPYLKVHFEGLFPMDSLKNLRFSINFFTSIGLGGLTEELREVYKKMKEEEELKKKMKQKNNETEEELTQGDEDVSSESSSSSSSSSSSDEDDDGSGSSSTSASVDEKKMEREQHSHQSTNFNRGIIYGHSASTSGSTAAADVRQRNIKEEVEKQSFEEEQGTEYRERRRPAFHRQDSKDYHSSRTRTRGASTIDEGDISRNYTSNRLDGRLEYDDRDVARRHYGTRDYHQSSSSSSYQAAHDDDGNRSSSSSSFYHGNYDDYGFRSRRNRNNDDDDDYKNDRERRRDSQKVYGNRGDDDEDDRDRRRYHNNNDEDHGRSNYNGRKSNREYSSPKRKSK